MCRNLEPTPLNRKWAKLIAETKYNNCLESAELSVGNHSETMFSMEKSFFFTELFLSTSCLYSVIVLVIVTSSVYGLMLQKALSECFALTLFMTCYLIFNDDILNYHYSFSVNLSSNTLPIVTAFPEHYTETALQRGNMDYHDVYPRYIGVEPNAHPKAFVYMLNNSIIIDSLGRATKITICFSSGLYFLIVSNYLK